VDPIYPWTPGDWNSRPAVEQPIASLRRPERLDKAYEVQPDRPGMETMVLLACEAPLPAGADLKKEFGSFGKQTEQDNRACAWFENGQRVKDRHGRHGKFNEANVKDPVLVAQQRIQEVARRLGIPYTRSVSFANQGK
jgi:hypothetical protein